MTDFKNCTKTIKDCHNCLNCKHYEEILFEIVDYCKKKEKAIYFLCEDCESFEKLTV